MAYEIIPIKPGSVIPKLKQPTHTEELLLAQLSTDSFSEVGSIKGKGFVFEGSFTCITGQFIYKS